MQKANLEREAFSRSRFQGRTRDMSKVKVLMIEDNEQNRYLAKFLLEANGFEVLSAEDGAQGIDLAAKVIPDLILLDIQLPTMDGYTVVKELRKNPRLSSVPVIAVTSYAMPGDKECAIEAGCNGYIEKPINPETFIKEIEQYILTNQVEHE